MQIFVKKITDGRTLALDVAADTTISQLQEMVVRGVPQFGGKWPSTLVLKLGKTSLDTQKTISDYPEIRAETNLTMGPAETGIWQRPKPEVIAVLKWILRLSMDTHTGKKIALFIGVGSACYSDRRIEEQQFPRWFQRLCPHFDNSFVILVDAGFEEDNRYQIYDIDGNWSPPMRLKGVARMYEHKVLKTIMYVFPTNSLQGEYDVPGVPFPTTLAGFPYSQIGRAIESTGGMLVAGNFYSAHAEPYYLSPGYEGLKHEM
jgi:hypothetical protein